MAASGSAQSRCQEPKSGLKRVRSEAGSAVSSRKRRASGSSACGSSSTPVLSAFHLPQTLDKPSSETSGPNHRKTVKVASRCASSLDTWRQANPVIFSTRLVAAEEDTSCSAAHTAHTNPGDLAANCDYFQALFSNYRNFADTADVSRLAVHTGLTQELLHTIVEALYACSITLDTTNAEAVLHAATFLGCHPLVCATIAYIAQTYLPHHFLEVSSLAHHLDHAVLAMYAGHSAISQPWTGEHRVRLQQLLSSLQPSQARALFANPRSAAVSELEVIDLVSSVSTERKWLDAIDFGRLGRAEIMALGRKITSLRSHPNMFKGHPASSSTCCTKLPPLWEGLSAAALHFFSVGQDNRFPSHAGACTSKLLRVRQTDASGQAVHFQGFKLTTRQGHRLQIAVKRREQGLWSVELTSLSPSFQAAQQHSGMDLEATLFLLSHSPSLESRMVHQVPVRMRLDGPGASVEQDIFFKQEPDPLKVQMALSEDESGYADTDIPSPRGISHPLGICVRPLKT